MQAFAELGTLIEERWRNTNYNDRAFPEIAAQALAEKHLPDHISAWDIIRWVHSAASLPAQMDLDLDFGNPPITLFVGPRFYIDVYFWLDGTTSIHQHRFSGAFQVLLGSSVQAKYSFEKEHEINPHFLIGKVSLNEVSLLRKGDIRQILAGPAFIHSLFHLDRPSATITVRTYRNANSQVQYSYLKPFVARNPFFSDPLLKRKVQTVDLLLRMKHPEADKFIADIINTSDLQTAFSVLDKAFGFLCHRELEEIVGVTRSRDRFHALLDRAQERHGALAELLLPVFEEEWRQNDISQRRAEIKGEDHRFFLALLLNVPERTKMLCLVKKRFPDKNAIDLVVSWVRELTATKTFGSREQNVLGLENFDEGQLFVLRGLLEGLTVKEIQAKAAAERDRDAKLQSSIGEVADHIRNLTLFKSIFAD